MEKISAFGAGSRGAVDGGGALEREMHVGEFESGVLVTKMTRYGYLRTRVVTAELQAASVSSFEARTRGTTAAAAGKRRQRMGNQGGLCSGLYRPAGGGNREGEIGGVDRLP